MVSWLYRGFGGSATFHFIIGCFHRIGCFPESAASQNRLLPRIGCFPGLAASQNWLLPRVGCFPDCRFVPVSLFFPGKQENWETFLLSSCFLRTPRSPPSPPMWWWSCCLWWRWWTGRTLSLSTTACSLQTCCSVYPKCRLLLTLFNI